MCSALNADEQPAAGRDDSSLDCATRDRTCGGDARAGELVQRAALECMLLRLCWAPESPSIPTPQPVHYRPMFASLGRSLQASSVSFVSQAGAGMRDELGLQKEFVPVSGTRSVTKKDMVHNGYTPEMFVDPETYEVRADGELLVCEPAEELSMAQRYFLF